MDTQKKRKKNEVNTKTQKPENKDNHSKKKGKKRGEIRNSQQITKKKKKERKGGTYLEKMQHKLEEENRRSKVGVIARASGKEGTRSNE